MATESTRQRPPWLDPQQPRAGRYVLGPFLGQGGLGEVREAWDLVLCRTRGPEGAAEAGSVQPPAIHAGGPHPGPPDPPQRLPGVRCGQRGRQAPHRHAAGARTHPGRCGRGPDRAGAGGDHGPGGRRRPCGPPAEPHPPGLEAFQHPPGARPAPAGWTPYVCDFGLAMEVGEPGLTGPVCVQGTPAYMAPEQLRGERDRIGPATDVFALGGTLSFALRGQVPGSPPVVRAPGAPPPRKVPRDLEHIVTRCMGSEPECRRPQAAALAEDLGRFLKGERVQARPLGPLGRAGRRLRGSWKPALAATLASACLLALASREHRQLASTSRRRSAWERHSHRGRQPGAGRSSWSVNCPPTTCGPRTPPSPGPAGTAAGAGPGTSIGGPGRRPLRPGRGAAAPGGLGGGPQGAGRAGRTRRVRRGPRRPACRPAPCWAPRSGPNPKGAFSGSPEDDAGEAAPVTAKVEALLRAWSRPDGQPVPWAGPGWPSWPRITCMRRTGPTGPGRGPPPGRGRGPGLPEPFRPGLPSGRPAAGGSTLQRSHENGRALPAPGPER